MTYEYVCDILSRMSTLRRWALAGFGLAMFLATATAAAAPSEGDEPCPPLTRRHSYGWQTLATDGAGIGLIVLGGAMHFEAAAAVTSASIGGASLLLGGPLVHVAHGRWPIGVLDFGMRLTLPLVGGYVASLCTEGECGGAFVAGALIGVAPIWLDAGLLAWEEVPVETAQRARGPRVLRQLARLGVSELHPTTRVSRRALELGLAGTF